MNIPLVDNKHYLLTERFWSKIITEPNSGCWLWTSNICNNYGQYKLFGKGLKAHKFLYEIVVKKVDVDKELHHLCEVKICVNPKHLKEVTHSENILLSNVSNYHYNKYKTYCKNGHPFNIENTGFTSHGRRCLLYHKLNEQKRQERLKS